MSTDLGSAFEQGIITAANLGALNIEPGSMRIRELSSPDVTVRLTVIASVPRSAVDALVAGLFVPPVGGGTPPEGEPNVVEGV